VVKWVIMIYQDGLTTGGVNYAASIEAPSFDAVLAELRRRQQAASAGQETRSLEGPIIPLSYKNWFGPVPVFYRPPKGPQNTTDGMGSRG